MNKKIILLVAVLLIVAVIFVACKGKGDGDDTTTEPTSESTTESTVPNVEIQDMSGELESGILPGVVVDGDMSGEGIINIGGNEESSSEDSISWEVIAGKKS